ncbi:LysR family transcriptional regulator [Frondihabitans australicus]|uniref:DNA-binding transcriptional LysR family regulator n=1 Tax=Frondihabitans australicus TaxID=386892 RepID=A0A495IDA9_9MICO|nr:LysR family transcriptional regulator [Frondihabitans australicus]RKR73301.1 DNA-binding transcriptional LysR family regulator [Frondihabitans australicus]
MELAQLRALRELGDRGSIAAVAALLRVTPSSVSQQIAALQRQSTLPLTQRMGRRTVLTDAGRALAEAAVDVEVALARATQAVEEHRTARTGHVAVAAFHSAGSAMFGALLRALDGPALPAVSLSDFDVAQEEFPRLTAEHDLVIAHRLDGSPPWPRSLSVRPLLIEPLDIAVRRDHRLASHTSIEPGDLDDEVWVAVHDGFPLAHALQTITGISGSAPSVAHRVNDFRVAADIVAASGSIALMPRYMGLPPGATDIVLRPLSHPHLGRHIDSLARPETRTRTSVQIVDDEIGLAFERLAAG